MKKLLLLLFTLTLLFSCEGSVIGYVPAVSGAEGTIVEFQITLEQGTGMTYVSTSPLIGLATQESINTAIDVAYSLGSTERNNCDIFIIFNSQPVEHVDGPSAGASITAHIFSLIHDLEIRKDSIITGGIDQFGSIVPVGGIYEKSMIAAQNGFKYLIVPPITIQEKMLLSELKEDYDFDVIEVFTIGEVIDFVIYGLEIEETLFTLPKEELYELIDYPYADDSDLQDFNPVVADMIFLQEQSMNEFSVPEDFDSISEYYGSVLNNTFVIQEKGYSFTAANRAFLDYIDLSTISYAENLDLNEKKQEVEDCLDSLPEVKKTKENFEWVISAELREYWAKQRLKTIVIEEDLLLEEKYFILNDLMYVDAWCHVSNSLRTVALDHSQGSEINDSIWKDYAIEIMNEAELIKEENSFILEDNRHFESSKMLFDDEKYGAAMYDILYFIELDSVDYTTISESKLNSTTESFSEQEPSSVWGKIYHTQGYYLSQGSYQDKLSAAGIYNYAFAVDEVTAEMTDLIPEEDENDSDLCLPAALLLFCGITQFKNCSL